MDILKEIEKNMKGRWIKGFEKTSPRAWNSIKKEKCEICNETRYLEKCHIIPRSFDWFLVKYNLLEGNTLILCPNCHKYFDKGLLNNQERDIVLPKVEKAISNFVKEYVNLMSSHLSNKEISLCLDNKQMDNKWVKQLILSEKESLSV